MGAIGQNFGGPGVCNCVQVLTPMRLPEAGLAGLQELLADLRLPPHVAGLLLEWQELCLPVKSRSVTACVPAA